MSTTSVILVDDHPVIRVGIRNLLEREKDIIVVAEATRGDEALQIVKDLRPDLMILDVELPDLNGVELLRQLQEHGLAIKVLILSAHDEQQYVQGLLTAGASGYLVKDEAPETIVDAVRGVSRGETGWVSRRVAARMSLWMLKEDQVRVGLTAREMEVLRAVVTGKTNREIGLALRISEKTVEKHLEGIYNKLNVVSRVEAAVLAIREDLV